MVNIDKSKEVVEILKNIDATKLDLVTDSFRINDQGCEATFQVNGIKLIYNSDESAVVLVNYENVYFETDEPLVLEKCELIIQDHLNSVFGKMKFHLSR